MDKYNMNDVTSYGGFKPSYKGAAMPGKESSVYDSIGYGASGTKDYDEMFAKAAGAMYGAVRALYDSMQGKGLYGNAIGGPGDVYNDCNFPNCPHHGAGMKPGGLETQLGKGYGKPAGQTGRYRNH